MSPFSLREKVFILHPCDWTQVGKEYRQVILEAGGSVDGTDMLEAFLGRRPRQDAFFKCKGLVQSQDM